MDPVPLSTLCDRDVMTADGTRLGTLDNITLNPATGRLEYLCIDPDGRDPEGFRRMSNGQVVVHVDRAEPKREYILVTTPE